MSTSGLETSIKKTTPNKTASATSENYVYISKLLLMEGSFTKYALACEACALLYYRVQTDASWCSHKGAAHFGSFQLFGSSLWSDIIDSGAVDYSAREVRRLSLCYSSCHNCFLAKQVYHSAHIWENEKGSTAGFFVLKRWFNIQFPNSYAGNMLP